MRNALRKLHPDLKIFGCWFHFCQAVKRQAKKLNELAIQINQNKSAQLIYHKLLSLPLLPPKEINTAFHILCTEAKEIDEKSFLNFLLYYERHWLVKVKPNYLLY